VFFDRGTSLSAGSGPILDEVARNLKALVHLRLIEIAGHTDERGPDTVNLAVTVARAKVVRDALVARGVAASRLRVKGYGAYCPLDPAHDEAAWSKNRRVSFDIVIATDRPRNTELGCEAARLHGVVPDPSP
jgi:outer membrane protein OmpA-like peptidoglycan-associated protein